VGTPPLAQFYRVKDGAPMAVTGKGGPPADESIIYLSLARSNFHFALIQSQMRCLDQHTRMDPCMTHCFTGQACAVWSAWTFEDWPYARTEVAAGSRCAMAAIRRSIPLKMQ
jgi:hypothetical protein